MALPFNINPQMLAAFGRGLSSGTSPMEQIANGLNSVGDARAVQGQRNKTLEFLSQSPEISQMVQAGVLSPGDGLKALLQQQNETRKAQMPNRKFQTLADGTYGFADENSGTFTPMGRAPKSNDNPALVQEFEYAKRNGYNGSFSDYVQFKGSNSGLTLKAPTGFRFTDDSQSSLEPIPGGPGEQLPGELAARIGMADSFRQQAPALREKLTSGDMTGPYDATKAQWGFGEQGETYRQLQSGTDALMRLLTGAGMNESEARAYSERYLPTRKDTPETAAGKLDQLVRELESTKAMAMRGRGGSQTAPQAQQPGGVVDYTDYFK